MKALSLHHFFLTLKILIAISSAAVPLLTAHPNLRVKNFAIFFSNSLTLGPSEEIHPDLIDFATDKASVLLINGVLTGINFLYLEQF